MDTPSPAKAGFFSKKTLAGIGLFVLAIVVSVGAKAVIGGLSKPERPQVDVTAAISGPKRTAFVKSFDDNCVRTQRAAPINKAISEAAIKTYCSCFSDAVANQTTNLELLTYAGMLTQAQQDRNDRLARACMPKG